MWIVVYMTRVSETAETILELLRSKGLLVKLRDVCKNKAEASTNSSCFEILVPEPESQDAHNIIIDAGF